MKKLQTNTDKLYFVTRRDLPAGAQLAQTLHAFHEFFEQHPAEYREWYESSKYIAALSVKDESELKSLCDTLMSKNFKFSVFTEPDLKDQLTSISVQPGQDIAKTLSHLPLALKEYNQFHINKLEKS